MNQVGPGMKRYPHLADLEVLAGQEIGTSAWLTIEALDDGGVLHADITPLTIARAHRRASAAVDLPQPVVDRWQSLLERLCLVPRLAARDWLEVAYTLTLQDRLNHPHRSKQAGTP